MMLLAQLTFQRPDLDLGALYPLAVLAALMVATLCFELKSHSADSPGQRLRPIAMTFAAFGLIALAVSYLVQDNRMVETTFNGMLANDPLSRWSGLVIAGCALLAILAGQEELDRHHSRYGGEYVALVLGASLGMVLMASALSTMVMFLGLELFSIALYLLCIFFPEKTSSQESGMKYFLLSSAASAVMLYGMALLYGATGTTWIMEMGQRGEAISSSLAVVGAVLVICGLLFKLAVVPFHTWAPDVYEGAPTTVTAFMSVATKVAAIAALWRIFVWAAPELGGALNFIVIALAVVSMAVGNLMALAQTSVKRMLAYSGIGNAGYLLIAPAVGGGMEAPMMFFLSAYMFGNIGAFLSLSVVEGLLGREVLRSDLRGLYRTHPALAAVFALSLISLAGLPPAGGFLAKFFLFGRAIGLGSGLLPSLILPAAGIVFSIVAATYYLSTAISLFDGREESAVEAVLIPVEEVPGVEPPTSMTSVALVVCAVGILSLGLMPGWFMSWLGG